VPELAAPPGGQGEPAGRTTRRPPLDPELAAALDEMQKAGRVTARRLSCVRRPRAAGEAVGDQRCDPRRLGQPPAGGEVTDPTGARPTRARSPKTASGPGSTPAIVIIGAGFGGIGLAALLKRAGISTFTIYEKADGVGGAWWHNRYPGAEVDTHSCVYSYPFKPYRWSRSHARREEVQRYLAETVEQFGLGSHLVLGVGVRSATWDESAQTYQLDLDNGEQAQCHVLVAATGFLNIPRYPSWPGLESFRGPKFHTARWEPQWDLAGQTVAVTGTGSTASQLVPELARIAGKVYLFQREPGWIIPKGEHDHSARDRARLGHPAWYRWQRIKLYRMIGKAQRGGALYTPGSAANEKARGAALAFIERELGDRPDLAKAVTPTYPFWGKRVILNSTFYAALKSPNVELIPRAVAAVTQSGVVDADGVERDVDVLIMATGFQTTSYAGTLEIRGRDGRTLREYWNGEPRAFLGITVPGFPNLYLLYGPGTNGGEIVWMLMQQAKYIVRSVRRMARGGLSSLEVRPMWAAGYDAWLQSKVEATAWAVSSNYYKVPSGKVVTQWPSTPQHYATLVRLLGGMSVRTRRRGTP
jgi:cation diffusion facilitator CzcD-associated flavoprotein CzcO